MKAEDVSRLTVEKFRDSVNTTMVTVLEAEKESAKTEKETQAAEKKLEIWNQLRGKGTYEITGNDTEIRPLMVDLQKKFEGVLANMSSYKKMPVVCVIHTPLPCTPLRVKLDEKITPGIAAPEIAEDPVRAATITNRTDILTKLLRAQGKIINVYSKEQTATAVQNFESKQGDPKADPASLKTFNDYTKHYNNLIDKPFNGSIADEESGASYVMQLADGVIFPSLRAYQAHSPANGKPWGYWLGTLKKEKSVEESIKDLHTEEKDSALQQRHEEVQATLRKAGVVLEKELQSLAEERAQPQQKISAL